MPARVGLPGIDIGALDRVTLPETQAWTLPPAAYIRDDIFTLERDQILRRSWTPLARVDQLPAPGDYQVVDLVGQPVLVVRGEDGEIRVMSAVCLHRGAPVAEGAGRRRLFTCPYHSWTYDTRGALVRAPLMDGAKGFEPGQCRLPQIRTEIWQGFVLANLDTEAAPFAPQVEGLTRYFQAFDMAGMVVARTLSFDSGWNWKVLVDNFMEAYHHIGPHAATFEPNFHAADSKVLDNDGPWSILHMPAAPAETPEHRGLVQGLADWQARDLFAAVMFPHFMIAPHGDGMAWYQVFPKGPDRMALDIHICLPAFARELADFDQIADASAAFVNQIHQEDIAANDQVWRGLTAPLTRQGRVSPLERSIWQFNQWWVERMTAEWHA